MNKFFEGKRIAVVIPHNEFTGRGQEVGGHVTHSTPDDDRQLGFEMGLVLLKRDIHLATVRKKTGGGFQPEKGLLGEFLPCFAGVIRIIEADCDHLGGRDRSQGFDAFTREGALAK